MLSNQNVPQMPLRCDHCIKIHRKCSRTLPKCTKCIEKGVECIYRPRSNYTKHLFKFEDKLNTFKIEGENEYGRKKKSRSYNFILECSSSPTKLPNNFNINYTILSIIRKFPRKDAFENLMTLIQYPSPYEPSDNISLFLTLTEKLGFFAKKEWKLILPEKCNLKMVPIYDTILCQAYNKYFSQNNNILPLFIEEEMTLSKKGNLLKIAILTCGLIWMEQNNITKTLLNFFSHKLYHHLQLTYFIKPSLENIQIILLVITGLSSLSWTLTMKEKLLAHAYTISTILGLHLNSTKVIKSQRKERGLTYSALIYLHLNANLMFSPYVPTPYKHLSLERMYNQLIKDLSKPEFNQQINNLATACSIVLSSFYNNISMITFFIRKLKFKYLSKVEGSSENLTELSNNLLHKIQKICTKHQATYKLLMNKYAQPEEIKFIEDFSNHIMFAEHYYNYFIHSLYFYRLVYNDDNRQIFLNRSKPKILDTMLECRAVIEYAILLPHYHMITFGIANISQCLVFISRYNGFVNYDMDSIMIKGLNHLKQISSLNYFPVNIKLNLTLLNIIQNVTDRRR